ncbi:MAG: hypothetical protein Q8P93_00135 [bacterium]|nr:hypothetical protein [bacterium]
MKKEKNIDDRYLIEKITEAIHETTDQQSELMKHGRAERNFSGYLANSIRDKIRLKNTKVDAPYNRHLGATKRLNGELIELDIAIHTRDTDENNLVAIELETINSPARDDVWKVEGLTKVLDGYQYQLGLFLVVGIKNNAGKVLAIEWYKNGRQIQAP